MPSSFYQEFQEMQTAFLKKTADTFIDHKREMQELIEKSRTAEWPAEKTIEELTKLENTNFEQLLTKYGQYSEKVSSLFRNHIEFVIKKSSAIFI